jgi:cysteine desulfurase
MHPNRAISSALNSPSGFCEPILIYLDNNATTLLAPSVMERMNALMQLRLANPSSQHSAGRRARHVLEQARETILHGCGGRTQGMASDQLIFTSGGTESNNLAIFGMTQDKPGAIVVSAIEHPSVLACAEALAAKGREVRYLPCNSAGVVCLDRLADCLDAHQRGDTVALVSLMLANNETGVLQPVAKAAEMCRKVSVPIHTDAVQILGKMPLDFATLDVDALTITAHKLHGPVGIGGILVRRGVELSPRALGGFQQLGLRPGTEPSVLAGGFETAVLEATRGLRDRGVAMAQLRDALQLGIQGAIEDCVIVGAESERLPHTLSVSFPGVDRQALQLALDMAGIACSTGSACASGSSQPSHVLQAMQLAPEVVRGGIRFSLSTETIATEIDETIQTLKEIVGRLRAVAIGHQPATLKRT